MISTGRRNLAAGALSSKVYVVGGDRPGTKAAEQFDPSSYRWTTRTAMPGIVDQLAAAEARVGTWQGLFALGGDLPSSYGVPLGVQTKIVQKYNPIADNWAERGFDRVEIPSPKWIA